MAVLLRCVTTMAMFLILSLPAIAKGEDSRNQQAIMRLPLGVTVEELKKRKLPAKFRRQQVSYSTGQPPGTIVINTQQRYLYYVLGKGKAMRYGVGVGKYGFTWKGTEKITKKAEWPDWRPPREMRRREPWVPAYVPGGPRNPLGARALYLGNTEYRIHGTLYPWTIGMAVSSGCIRLTNDDVVDLYQRVKIGAKVVVN